MNLKQKIVQHYDELSPYYRDLWGVHIHHGYWKSGSETKEEAQEQLIRELVSRAGIQNGARILDVGCGLGGAAIYLNKVLGAKVTGITISSTQIEMAKELVRHSGAEVRLMLMDAEALEMDERFDVVWSVEAISHLNEKARCFVSIQRLLQPGGTLVIDREPGEDHAHEDMRVAVRDAFDAARRRLQDRMRKLDGNVKQRATEAPA